MLYLDELVGINSLGVEIVKLVVEPEETAVDVAKSLVERAKVQLTNPVSQENIIELIETIIVYKLPQKSRKEIAAMFNLGDLKQTRFYQDAFADGKQEGKKEVVPRLLPLGLRLEGNC